MEKIKETQNQEGGHPSCDDPECEIKFNHIHNKDAI